jgi:hypothetical protein
LGTTYTVTVRDYVVGEFLVIRSKSKVIKLTDKAKTVDVLTKVAYKLAGKDVRRVYWHKVWKDIIEDTDHNINIDCMKILLERMKQLKEALE